MGSYISDNISKNENVTYEAHYHWIIWFKLTSVLSLFIKPFLMTKFDEFAITNKRIIMKTGIISRKVFEMTIPHIESINVEQTIMGRILGYGTIIIVGSGGTTECFNDIASPLKFRKAFMDEVQ